MKNKPRGKKSIWLLYLNECDESIAVNNVNASWHWLLVRLLVRRQSLHMRIKEIISDVSFQFEARKSEGRRLRVAIAGGCLMSSIHQSTRCVTEEDRNVFVIRSGVVKPG